MQHLPPCLAGGDINPEVLLLSRLQRAVPQVPSLPCGADLLSWLSPVPAVSPAGLCTAPAHSPGSAAARGCPAVP